MPVYKYKCECGHTLEISESTSSHKARKAVRCKCKKNMHRDFATNLGGMSARSYGGTSFKTLGMISERNADRMSTDEKIAHRLRAFDQPNAMLRGDTDSKIRERAKTRLIREIERGESAEHAQRTKRKESFKQFEKAIGPKAAAKLASMAEAKVTEQMRKSK